MDIMRSIMIGKIAMLLFCILPIYGYLISTEANSTSNMGVVNDDNQYLNQISSNVYVETPPIFIDGDSQFISANFPGAGTIEDPYLIENYNITSVNQPAILISNTIFSFIIRNNLLESNIDQSVIYVENSIDLIIENNTVMNGEIGIFLAGSASVTISNNTISEVQNGITVEGAVISTNHYISGNNITGKINAAVGIMVSEMSYVMIENNYVTGFNGAMIILNAVDISIKSNQIDNNFLGLQAIGTSNLLVQSNLIIDNSEYGLIINDDTNYATVVWNNFTKNNVGNVFGYGPASQATDRGTHNSFSENYWSDAAFRDTDLNGVPDPEYHIDSISDTRDYTPATILDPSEHKLSIINFNFDLNAKVISEQLELDWAQSADSHDHLVYYSLYFSLDNSEDWSPYEERFTDSSYSMDTTLVPDNSQYRLRILVSDESYAIIYNYDTPYTFEINNNPIIVSSTVDVTPTSTPIVGTESSTVNTISSQTTTKSSDEGNNNYLIFFFIFVFLAVMIYYGYNYFIASQYPYYDSAENPIFAQFTSFMGSSPPYGIKSIDMYFENIIEFDHLGATGVSNKEGFQKFNEILLPEKLLIMKIIEDSQLHPVYDVINKLEMDNLTFEDHINFLENNGFIHVQNVKLNQKLRKTIQITQVGVNMFTELKELFIHHGFINPEKTSTIKPSPGQVDPNQNLIHEDEAHSIPEIVELKCTSCKNKIDLEDVFCGSCGTVVS